MIEKDLEVSLHMLFVESRQDRYKFITIETLLLTLLRDNILAKECFLACASEERRLEICKKLREWITQNVEKFPEGKNEIDSEPEAKFQTVISNAFSRAELIYGGKKEVNGADVLLSIFFQKDSMAVAYLHQAGITRLDFAKYLKR
jgi:ATP-dependent Clp protease ATP-binding subunit ClpA